MKDPYFAKLAELRDGREAALSFFMDVYAQPLTYFADGILKNHEAAEEIVCDTFVKLWQRKDHFHTPDKLKAFLYIATKNACLDYQKSPANRLHYDELTGLHADAAQDVLAQIIHAEAIQLLYAEVDQLPPQQAAIFKLTYFEGLTTDEICERLQTNANSVFAARSKATAALKKVLWQKDLLLWVALLQLLHHRTGVGALC